MQRVEGAFQRSRRSQFIVIVTVGIGTTLNILRQNLKLIRYSVYRFLEREMVITKIDGQTCPLYDFIEVNSSKHLVYE
jgi:hypothetical protein